VTKGKTITLLDSTSEPWELLEEPGRCPMRVRAVNYPRFIEPTANHPSTQQEVRLDSPIDKLLMSVSNFAAELERAKASQRRRDALQVKAQRGYVVGGVMFGYRNVPVLGDGGQRSHVVREIREDEAATVRRIFTMVGAGTGLRKIAQTLNVEGLRSPRARAGRHHSWAASSIRAVLFNRLYKGEVVWGHQEA